MGNSNSNNNTNSSTHASQPVSEVLSSAEIVVFKMDGCSYCDSAVEALKKAGYEGKTNVVLASDNQRDELYDLTQVTSLPSIWVKRKFVGGCNDGPEPWMGIKKIIARDELKSMLEKE